MAKLIKKTYHQHTGFVFDLTVENTHSYNIEGIAVHNSGAGSLVNYLLGITQLDPIPYNLLWNRFLGRHRVNWPDIDTDAGNRDELIKAAQKLFGEEAVIPVSNFNTLKLKSLVKDISKFYNVPFEEVNAVTGPLQDEVMYHAMDDSMEKSVFVLKHEDCLEYSPRYKEFMEKYPQVEEHIRTLFTQNKSIGRHAGGVIVADPRELEETMPMVGVRGELQTPWAEGLNFRNLEDNGFLKFDFLGLTLLRDVENCIRRILKNQTKKDPTFEEVKKFFDEKLNCRFVKQDDPVVWKHVYELGHFTGIFQFAQSGARNFAMEAKPQNIEDLAAVTAIYRPGPLKANVHKKYVKVKEEAKKKPPKYAHPVIEEVLGPTYGFFCLAGDTKVLTSLGEKTIQEIVEKRIEVDLLSYNNETKSFENDRIVQFWDQGEKETIIIETDEGELELTHDHKVLTQRGWIKACELTESDSLIGKISSVNK